MAEVWRAFEVDIGTPGYGFTAVVLDKPPQVISNRHGTWHVEPDLFLADLTMSEHRYIEWLVREIDPATVKVPPEFLA
jgi:hypothetical protein